MGAEGGCDCRAVRYRMESRPLFVHCCHCRWCQRETGASFALNAMIEADRVTLLAGEPELVDTPSRERQGPEDRALPDAAASRVWSHYAGAGARCPLRARRHARRPRPLAARHPHLHGVEAALGRAARRARRRCPSTTTASSTGRPRASPGARRPSIGRKPDVTRRYPAWTSTLTSVPAGSRRKKRRTPQGSSAGP